MAQAMPVTLNELTLRDVSVILVTSYPVVSGGVVQVISHPAYGVSTSVHTGTVHPAYGVSSAVQVVSHPVYGVLAPVVQAGTVQPMGVATALQVQPSYGVLAFIVQEVSHPAYGVFASSVHFGIVHPRYGMSTPVHTGVTHPEGVATAVQTAEQPLSE